MDQKNNNDNKTLKNSQNSILDDEFDLILRTVKQDKHIKRLEQEDNNSTKISHVTPQSSTKNNDNSGTRISDISTVRVNKNQLSDEVDFEKETVKEYVPSKKKTSQKSENIVYFDDFEDNKNSGNAKKTGANNKQKTPVSFLGSVYAGIIKMILYIAFVFVCVYFLSTNIIEIGNDMFAFVKEDRDITVNIPQDASLSEIAKVLQKNGVIDNAFAFEKYTELRMKKANLLNGKFLSGQVTLNSNMNYDSIRKALALQKVRETIKVTIPEGLTVNETIELLVSSGVGTRENYIEAIQNYDYKNKIVQNLEDNGYSDYRKDEKFSFRLEGYLFPDTYEFYNDENAVSVIDKFLINFENKFEDTFFETANEMGYTMDQIITIASLIEKEAGKADEYANVSSVFHNRLNNKQSFPYLNSDATIQYALKERKSVLSGKDTEYDHPYNTYINKGLPPGPICNPGYEAIVAALYPAKTDYYYFVTGKDGVTVFAKTYKEHQDNVDRLLK